LLDSLNKTLSCIKNKINEDNLPQTFTAEEIAKAQKLPLQQLRICFKLIGHFALFNDPVKTPDRFGYEPITIKTHETMYQYLQYTSIESFIGEMLEYQKPFQKKIPIPSINIQCYSMNQSINKLMVVFQPVSETSLRRFIDSKENEQGKFIIKIKRGQYMYKCSQKDRIKSFLHK
jgi:hypothetical protein